MTLPHTSPHTSHASRTDVLIVGAGIVGLAHAAEAHARGLSVRIVEQDSEPVGASVRNFGHACITAQADDVQPVALASRAGWLRTASKAGIWAAEAGCVLAAGTAAEMEVLEQFAAHRGADEAELLTAEAVAARLGRAAGGLVGGAFFPRDLRVDPREAAPGIAAWLAGQGVDIRWRSTAHVIGDGRVVTSRGTFEAETVIVCVGHDLDRHFPELADRWQVQRCRLQMLLAEPWDSYAGDHAILTGSSILRYAGLAAMPAAATVRSEIETRSPELLEIVANIMATRRPDGSMLLGDTHAYGTAAPAFMDEAWTEHVLAAFTELFGRRPVIRQRWQGIYASSPLTEVVDEQVDARTRVVTVTSGIGMTLSFGLAHRTFEAL